MYSQAKLDIASKIIEWNVIEISTEDILNYIDSHFQVLLMNYLKSQKNTLIGLNIYINRKLK